MKDIVLHPNGVRVCSFGWVMGSVTVTEGVPKWVVFGGAAFILLLLWKGGLKWGLDMGREVPLTGAQDDSGRCAGRVQGNTETYAVLQASLEQVFPVEVLQEVVAEVPGLCAGDCARMSREAYGIVAGDLTEVAAQALSGGLNGRGLETKVVPETSLFPLPQGFVTRHFEVAANGVLASDAIGREILYGDDVCVFVAGGWIRDRARRQKMEKHEEVKRDMSRKGAHKEIRIVRKDEWEAALICRIEVYVKNEPYRLIWQCDDQRPAYWCGKALLSTDREAVRKIFEELGAHFPGKHVNGGMRELAGGGEKVYPSLSAFEEEIVWRFSSRP